MSPETGNIQKPTIMAEAEMISQELIVEQGKIVDAVEQAIAMRLIHNRARVGDATTESIDQSKVVDTNTGERLPVIIPELLETDVPLTQASLDTTLHARTAIGDILTKKSNRLLVIVGPCSIHDPESTLEYARHIKEMRQEFGKHLEIVMRFYPEKPRTELGWKGLIYDPKLDNSNDINLGVTLSRLLACRITSIGVPTAMERLNASTPQYFNGLVAYDAIGARNTTDQKAREYASGTSSPVGFKNTPEGSIVAAAEAVRSANAPHVFLGMHVIGLPTQEPTRGNPLAHIILRGGQTGPNYSAEDIENSLEILRVKELLQAIVIDASHGNSVNPKTGKKDAAQQIEVIQSIAQQIMLGQTAIRGVMIEGNLKAGEQTFSAGTTNPLELKKGVSITDACSGLEETKGMLALLSGALMTRAGVE